jgi:hypothetical protein
LEVVGFLCGEPELEAVNLVEAWGCKSFFQCAMLCCAVLVAVCLQADDSGVSIKVVRGREALPSELGTVLEVAQEYNEQREGVKHSTMQTVSQIIT